MTEQLLESKESAARYRGLLEAAPDAIVVVNQAGEIVLLNVQAEKQFGYGRDELLGQKVKRIIPEGFAERLIADGTRSAAEALAQEIGAGIELKGRRKDRSEFPIEIMLSPLKSAEGLLTTAAIRNITRRKQTEEALRQSEERLSLLIDGVKDYAILMLDPHGRVAIWNAGAERIKGYRAEEIIGEHFSKFYTPEDKADDKPSRELVIATKQGRFEEESWAVRKDGSRFWANVVITALRDHTGQLRGFGRVTQDITERREAEDESDRQRNKLARSNAELISANKELEAFSYSVSHDLRAPLRAIDGFSHALIEDFAARLDDTGKSHLNRIRAAAQKMGSLIDDLLNLSRLSRAALRRQTLDISALVGSIASDLQEVHPERRIDLRIEPGLQVSADPGLMRVVLENLLSNAWKFTSKREFAKIEFGMAGDNGAPSYFLRDNGAGFDPEYAGRLFGAFQRLHPMTEFAGTGIGLATVHRIVLRHGGRIWAESAVDCGATFYFTLTETTS